MDTRKNIVIRAHGSKSSQCYVTAFQAPLSVWKAYQRGSYQNAFNRENIRPFMDSIAAHGIRWGAYGDPALIPAHYVGFLGGLGRSTGYSHQWREAWAQDRRGYLMASVESVSQALEAQALGWRTFRVDQGGAPFPWENEISCPASDEAGNKTDCQTCGLCNGAAGSTGPRASQQAPKGFKSNGLVLWEGPSPIDDKPIVAIVTGLKSRSANPKTGSMLQVWILRADVAPHEAQKSGEDRSVCGDCPMRPIMAKLATGGV